MIIKSKNEKKLILTILEKLEVSKENALIVADVITDADLKGFRSHGIGRFHNYLKGIDLGHVNPKGKLVIEKETESIALINGNMNFGQVVAYKAMKIAIEKAKKTGIAAVGVRNSNHFGETGFYSDLARNDGVIGIVMTNTEPAIAPLGGKEAILGTNPLAIGIPSDDYLSLDMSTSISARGRLLEYSRRGEELPEGVALDSEGKPTTDPDEALKGSILPFGGHKGYNLAFMIEILAGPLVGAAYGKQVKGTATCNEKCTKGDLFIAIDPDKFLGLDKFKREVNSFINEIRTSEPNAIIPGDMEVRNIDKYKEAGLNVDTKLYDILNEICKNLNINLDEFIEQ